MQATKNLGWLFYKGYYQGVEWDKLKDGNEEYFKDENKALFEVKLHDTALDTKIGNTPIELTTTYPGMVMGVGYQHEIGAVGEAKIGFYFDYTTGLPCLTGSSVKGILRAAFPQFGDRNNLKLNPSFAKATDIQKAKAEYIGGLLGWEEKEQTLYLKVHQLELSLFEGVDIAASIEKEEITYKSIYQRDIFHDAFPIKGFPLLGEDYITPHVGGAKNNEELELKALQEPVPLLFIKVMPDVIFRFDFVLKDCIITAKEKKELFKNILLDLGAGAKTNVGYGQFVELNKEEKINLLVAIEKREQKAIEQEEKEKQNHIKDAAEKNRQEQSAPKQGEKIPSDYSKMKKGFVFEGTITEITDEAIWITYQVVSGNSGEGVMSKKIAKLKFETVPKLNDKVTITMNADFNGTGIPNCKITLKN